MSSRDVGDVWGEKWAGARNQPLALNWVYSMPRARTQIQGLTAVIEMSQLPDRFYSRFFFLFSFLKIILF